MGSVAVKEEQTVETYTNRCCECSASLSHCYYEKDGRLFCKKDYWAKFGELCHGCNDPITTGLIMPSSTPNPTNTSS